MAGEAANEDANIERTEPTEVIGEGIEGNLCFSDRNSGNSNI